MVHLAVTAPPYNTTFAGVIKGASDLLGLSFSGPDCFALSGHAFLINIHQDLCPSGPYCLDFSPLFGLLSKAGLFITPLGFFHSGSSREERSALEEKLKAHLEKGLPCALLNMEWQLIEGTDETGLVTSQPWDCKDFPPSHLTFQSWDEMGEDVHASFFLMERVDPDLRDDHLRDLLRYILELHEEPSAFNPMNGYAIGSEAWLQWRRALPVNVDTHGCWWNGTVWSECRHMANLWLKELGDCRQEPTATQAARHYEMVSENLKTVADKTAPLGAKLAALAMAEEEENLAIEQIRKLLYRIG